MDFLMKVGAAVVAANIVLGVYLSNPADAGEYPIKVQNSPSWVDVAEGRNEWFLKHKTPFFGEKIRLKADTVLIFPYSGMFCFERDFSGKSVKEEAAVCFPLKNMAEQMMEDFIQMESIPNPKSASIE